MSLQEANSVAIIDIASGELLSVLGLGFKDYGAASNELDPSNKDGGYNLASWGVKGAYMPDAITSYTVGGTTYLVTVK